MPTLSEPQLQDLLERAIRATQATTPPPSVLSSTELESLATTVTKNVLLSLGINTEDVLEMQKDFAFLHNLREGSESIRSKTWVTVIGILITGAISLIGMGIKSVWSHK